MTFGDKVKAARIKLNLTQEEAAERIGISRRAYISYEQDQARPRGVEKYKKLAKTLEIDINYILTDDEYFIASAEEEFGPRGGKGAERLITEVSGLFTGGQMADIDVNLLLTAVQEAYVISKRTNKKFTPKSYREKPEKP